MGAIVLQLTQRLYSEVCPEKEVYLDIYPDCGDINARVSQLIVIQCQCQIRQRGRNRIKTEPTWGFFLSACSYIRVGLPS